ncbi:FAD-binding domain-containing protein [Halobacterium rubrum]|uniref:FAD-binding domain-containing protein n=1 Tax=Halobacterium TaxID=2239 RepID=UPI001F46AA8D|nr:MULTISPECIES: deoxyribodipyrimidine photo-lyase [Halobacterium]MDH5019934.1 deoxyribodipyrimidine photo-lyase [Halobacterium rubrum]
MGDGPRIAVWHRDDFRVRDNAALAAAARDGDPQPVFIFDPQFYESGMACDARKRFVHQSIAALDAGYRDRGSSLVLRHGDPGAVLDDLDVDCVYVNRSVTGRYGRERDDRLFERDDVEVFADDGVDWTDRGRGDYDWQAQAEVYFERERREAPTELPANRIERTATVDAVETEYGVEPEKTGVQRGGESAAWQRLRAFTDAIGDYPGGISAPTEAEERTSRLSPYLAFGCLTPRQVHQYVKRETGDGRAVSMFESRLYWNRHYSQKLADWPGWTETAVNPVYRGLYRSEHDEALAAAWREGHTGYPLVDASMRALRETGWLNFRMRAMCATFYHYVLRCWWQPGADHFYRHLVDADAAINYTQWQTQCNLTGVHPVRVYNPRKQIRENDPDGEFVREYVPELRDLPDEHLARPEKAPLSVQDDCGVRIGEDYPRPVVEFEARREQAREDYARLADRAREVIEHDPEIRRRASLSRRGRPRPDGDESGDRPTAEEQASLGDF